MMNDDCHFVSSTELHAAITLWLKDFTPEEVSAGVSSALHPPVGKGRYPLSSTNGFGIGRKGWEAQTPPNGAQNGTSGPSGGPMGPSFRHILTPGDVKSLVRPDVTLRPAGMRL